MVRSGALDLDGQSEKNQSEENQAEENQEGKGKLGDKLAFLKKIPLKWVIIGGASFIILLSLLFLGLYLFSGESSKEEEFVPVQEIDVEAPDDMLELVPAFENIFPMDYFEDVRLMDTAFNRVLSARLDIEFEGEKTWEELVENGSRLHEMLTVFFQSKTSYEILNVEGRTALKYELIEVVNQMLKNKSVRNIYFIEFIVRTYKL